jgi:predicted nuclease of restriction endonuclease-like (RecB) superfamily
MKRPAKPATYDAFLSEVVDLLERARRAVARSVNSVLTHTYWEIGRRIFEHEQKGKMRADYGDLLLDQLAADLSKRFGRGFSRSNVFQMRQFYLAYQEKIQTVSGQSGGRAIVQTVSGQFDGDPFPLSWSHYSRLLSVADPNARAFYEQEAIRGGWSVRQLDRQISTLFYDRSLRSRKMLTPTARLEDHLTADEEIRDPFVLEFLGLRDEYSESDLEDALIRHLERFLLELGNDFTFVARQKRLRIGHEWYRVDLLFFHRRLRCLILIDLKLGKFTHSDAGQMNLYLNYAREHWTHAEENPPIGLILCSEKNAAVAHYALGNLGNSVLAREYQLTLPEEAELTKALAQQRRAIQARIAWRKGD